MIFIFARVPYASEPSASGALSIWTVFGAGRSHGFAIRKDGTLLAIGKNFYGLLGTGDRSNGTLWTMGWNHYGQLGLGDIDHRSSPVQIGTLNSWSKLPKLAGFFSMVLKEE